MKGARTYARAWSRARSARIRMVAVVLLMAGLVMLSGCVFSDTITERIYDQDPESQVDDSLDPILINSATAELTSDALPALFVQEEKPETEPEHNLPQYTDDFDVEQTMQEAAQTIYEAYADQAGEATNQSAPDSTSNNARPSAPDNQASDEGTSPEPASEGDPSSELGDNPDPQAQPGDDQPPTQEVRASGGTGMRYTADVAADPYIPPNINEVAAIGNNAMIVSMIGGLSESPVLLACDAATHSQANAVLANRGIRTAQPLFGTESEFISAENFDVLVNQVLPDLVFLTEGAEVFTPEQLDVLSQNNIDLYYLPKLTSATRIRYTVDVVGRILDAGGVPEAGSQRQAYLDWETDIVARYRDANGGLTGGFDFDSGRDSAGAPQTVVTLLVDQWDEDARYGDVLGTLNSDGGAAVATLGYQSAPVNYYLSAGGALNNAASQTMRNQGTSLSGIVWQFNHGVLPFSFDRWTGLHHATFDLNQAISGGNYTADLLWYTIFGAVGCGLGTSREDASFPAVIAKGTDIQSRILGNSSGPGLLYFGYGTINPGRGTTVGYFAGADTYVESAIGNAGGGVAQIDRGLSDSEVFVNPRSLVQADSSDALGSWIDGSAESPLEASWASYRFRTQDEGAFRQDVVDFYSRFYGYDITDEDFASIVAGGL